MTILNIWTGQDRAIVAVDTLASLPGLPHQPYELSKLFVLSHSNTILAGAGTYDLARRIYAELRTRTLDAEDFEGQWRVLIESVPKEWRAMSMMLDRAGISHRPPAQVLSLVGWSESEGRMLHRYVQRVEPANGFDQYECGAMSVNPPLPEWHLSFPEDADTGDKMLTLARQQLQWWKEAGPPYPTGGRLLIAELSRDSMLVSSRALG